MAIRRLGLTHQWLRQVIGCWPFERGTIRIPWLLGKVFRSRNESGVEGGVGTGSVLFPYQPGDIAHRGYWFLYEKSVRMAIKRFVTAGSIFIDIGAHRGWHAGYALALVGENGSVIACEPHPEHAEKLRSLGSLNPDKRMYVHEVAITDYTGEVTLLASVEEGWHTIVPDFSQISDVARRPILVAATTLDDLMAQYEPITLHRGPCRVVIKIDAEGSELSILKGGMQTLRLPSIRALLIECTGGEGVWHERAAQCVQILCDAGWIVRVLTTGRRSRPWEEHDARTQVNLIATRERS